MNVYTCSSIRAQEKTDEELLEETVLLVREVKQFGKTLGIEPTETLSRTSRNKPAHSMLWLWLQKTGTIAFLTPIDIQIGLRFSAPREELPVERLYHMGDYSIFSRQGNQFGDAHAVTTIDFARQPTPTKVETILHEDLHAAENFDLPWESEESLVTPLARLAAFKFFEHKGDHAHAGKAQAAIQEGRMLAKELTAVAREAEDLFQSQPLTRARRSVLKLISSRSLYDRWFKSGLGNQEGLTVLEAKISHDLAYYKYFDRIVSLYEKVTDLKKLIHDLKKIPADIDGQDLEKYLTDLEKRYGK